jgi:hypothetical protein
MVHAYFVNVDWSFMLESNALQLFVFPIGMLYFLLHVGPLFRLWYEPSIQGGTRWKFFASELVVFSLWLFGSPVLWHSQLGRLVITAHLSMHVIFTAMDYWAHDFLIGTALVKRSERPLMWFVKEFGLVIDTATHGIATVLVGLELGPRIVAMSSILSIGMYAIVTRGYLQQYGKWATKEA